MSHTRALPRARAQAHGVVGGVQSQGAGWAPAPACSGSQPPPPNAWASSAPAACSLVPVPNLKTWGLSDSLLFQERKLRPSQGSGCLAQVELVLGLGGSRWVLPDSQTTISFRMHRPHQQEGGRNAGVRSRLLPLHPRFSPPSTHTTMCIRTLTLTLSHTHELLR